MYIFKNAIKNLGRNLGRNLMLAVLMLILIFSTTIALVINTTSKNIIEDYKTKFGSKVTLSVDFDQLMAEAEPSSDGQYGFPTIPTITPEQYIKFAQSDQLKSYQISMMSAIVFDGLKTIGDSQTNQNMVGSIGGGSEEFISPKAKLMGYSSANEMTEFHDGLRKILDGKMYKEKNECLISSDFADLNQLKVGDTIEITDTYTKTKIMLRVVGVYADATKATEDLPEGAMSLAGSFQNRRNEILVDYKTMSEQLDVNSMAVIAAYELKSPEHVKDFEKELREKGLPSSFNVVTDEASFQTIVAPIMGLSNISLSFVTIILVVGCLVLLFITSMAIRERKYEIGVLRAIGMKKKNIIAMLVSEVLIITLLCLGIGLSAGKVFAQPVADKLIADQVESVRQQTQNMSGIGMSQIIGENEEVEPLSKLEVKLTTEAVIQITLIALALAMLSSVAGVIVITKHEPMKILSERN